MYFWGQLDLPRGEKIRRKKKPFKFSPRANQKEDGHVAPAGYELKFAGDVGVFDHRFALVGQPLTLEIFPRDENSSCTSCMVITVTYFCYKCTTRGLSPHTAKYDFGNSLQY